MVGIRTSNLRSIDVRFSTDGEVVSKNVFGQILERLQTLIWHSFSNYQKLFRN